MERLEDLSQKIAETNVGVSPERAKKKKGKKRPELVNLVINNTFHPPENNPHTTRAKASKSLKKKSKYKVGLAEGSLIERNPSMLRMS